MINFYNNVFLYGILEGYVQYLWVWLPILLLAILFLPGHRLAAQITVGVLTFWHLACWLLWDLNCHAPFAFWIIAAALLFRLLVFAWSLVPGGWFSTSMVRQYLDFDPGCFYLFDLARARRGISPLYTATQRKRRLPQSGNLSARALRFARAFAWLCDQLVELYARVPRYWRVPHRQIHLNQPHLWNVLRQEAIASEEAFVSAYQDTALEDYHRLPASEVLAHERRTRLAAHRMALMLEARAEYLVFMRPTLPGASAEKWEAFQLYAAAYRHRRTHDNLWAESAPLSVAQPQEEHQPNAQILQSSETADSSQPAPDEDQGITVDQPQETEDPLGLVESPQESSPQDGDKDAAAPEEIPPETESGDTAVTSAVQEEQPGAQDEDDWLSELIPQTASDGSQAAEDDDISESASLLSDGPQYTARQQDVAAACMCLESYLGLPSPQNFTDAVRQTTDSKHRQKSSTIVFNLLVMYCVRQHWVDPDIYRQLLIAVEWLWAQLAEARQLARRSNDKNVWHTFRIRRRSLGDLLISREDFARVRDLYRGATDLHREEHAMIGEACAGLARQVGLQEELRVMLLYEAIDHYFQAGMRSIWRRELAEKLIGSIRSQQELIELLQRYPVDFPAGLKFIAPVAPRAILHLEILTGDQQGETIPVTCLPFTLGRADDADRIIEDPHASRHHCQIQNVEGKAVLVDTNSRIGTFLNDVRIKSHTINEGDVITLAGVKLKVLKNK